MKKTLYTLTFLFIFTSCEALFVENISDKTIVLLAPTNNSEVQSGVVTFSWTKLDDADMYQIQIATPNFQNASQILLDSTTANLSIQKELTTGSYEWRVSGSNSEYSTRNSTNAFSVN